MWIKASLIAAGFVAATAAATPAPTLAQGVYIGPGGVAVDVGRPRYREHYRGYHDYAYDRRLPDGNHRASRKHAHDQTLRLAVRSRVLNAMSDRPRLLGPPRPAPLPPSWGF